MAAAIAHVFLLLYFSVEGGQAQLPLTPTIVLIGPIDSGKSSLGNALLGCDPRNSSCFFPAFPVCKDSEVDSCTKETTAATAKWLGKGEDIKVSV